MVLLKVKNIDFIGERRKTKLDYKYKKIFYGLVF